MENYTEQDGLQILTKTQERRPVMDGNQRETDTTAVRSIATEVSELVSISHLHPPYLQLSHLIRLLKK
ncbi:unnamed protein product [Musa hybrid cultivar]